MTRQQKWVLGLTSFASFMVSLDSLVVSTSLPTLRRDLGASLESLVWTVNAYNLAFAVLLLTGAALGDRFGRRRMFAAGLGLFTVASVACALAPNVAALIAARAVQGAGAALVTPVALAQLSAAFPPQRRGRALWLFLGMTGLATFLGPFVGGLLVQELSWRWIFWVNLPLGVLAVVLALARLAESRGANSRFDLVGVVLVTAGVFGLVWGLQRGGATEWGVEALTALGAGAIFVVLFLVWERRAPAPLLPARFFRLRGFAAGNAGSFVLFAQIYGTNFMLAQFLQAGQGHGPLAAGLRMMPFTATVLVIAPLAGNLVDRFGERAMVVVGLIVQAAGAALTAVIVAPTTPYLVLILPLVIGSCGIVLAMPATQKAVVGAVEIQEIGQASGAVTMLRYLGGVFGIALLGTVFGATGGYASPLDFTTGFAATMAVIAIFAVVGILVGLWLPGRRSSS